MTQVSFGLLSVAVLLGAFLIAGRLRRWALLHGGAGLVGVVTLALALWQGRLHGPFAWDAMVLGAGALAGGAVIYMWRGRRPALLVGLHATAGGLAYLLLSGFAFGR